MIVKKYTTIIKLTNLEGHARAHNTQMTNLCYILCNDDKNEVILWLIYGLFFL